MIPNTDATLHALYWEQELNDYTLVPVRAFNTAGLPMVLDSKYSRLVPANTVSGYEGIYDDLTENDHVTRTMF